MPPPADPTPATVTAALVRLQAARGYLPDAALRELAADLGQPLSRLEEVVSFFPHFRRTPPPESAFASARLYKLTDALVGLRPVEEDESRGLDIVDHGERAYNA